MSKAQKRSGKSVPPSSEVEEAAFEKAQELANGLFPHQVEGLAFLLARRRAILADDMGLGKTRQSIAAVMHLEPAGPYLVICPAAVKLNWEREIQTYAANARVLVVSGKDSVADQLASWSGWVIINYDILDKHFAILRGVPWAALIFDEAHYLKNRTSKRSKLARQLALESDADPLVYSLTGTPLTNRPRDLFPLLQLSNHSLGRSFLSFAKRYCAAKETDYGWVTDGASNLEELTLQLHGIMLRRRKEDVLNLPPKLRNWLGLEVDASAGASEMREVVATLVRSRLRREASGPADGRNPEAGDRQRLLASITTVRQKLAAAKSGQCVKFVEDVVEQGEKVIVFSCFDAPLKAVAKHFDKACVLVTGATPSGRRQALVDRFQSDPEVKVFAANIIAGGVGLNLTAARHVVFNDLDWVPANHWQAEDRAYRIGQQGTVNVHYLLGKGTIDDFVHAVLETKAALTEAVVDGGALSPAASRDVLSELEAIVGRLSAQLSEADLEQTDEEAAAQLIREAVREYANEHQAAAGGGHRPVPVLSEEALMALARVLTGPRAAVYRATSKSDPSKSYTLTAESGEVTCSCPGFEYRGLCSHSRELKNALVKKCGLPAGFTLSVQ